MGYCEDFKMFGRRICLFDTILNPGISYLFFMDLAIRNKGVGRVFGQGRAHQAGKGGLRPRYALEV
jgi:hypothetical protein